MKIKTADATELQLDWLVAKSEGHLDDHNTWLHKATLQEVEDGSYHPSTNWAQGGPIIERERMAFAFSGQDIDGNAQWSAGMSWEDLECNSTEGPTPLIAALRCFVANKLGDEVDILKELK